MQSHNSHNRICGFTLIELLVAMTVLVVLIGIGVPSFHDFLDSSRATTEYRQLVKAFGFARSEAITRGAEVHLDALEAAGWHKGFRVWVDASGDGDYDAGEELRTVDAFRSDATLVSSGDEVSFTYTAEGFLDAVAGTSFTIAYRTDPEHCARDRDIRVAYTGHVGVEERACE